MDSTPGNQAARQRALALALRTFRPPAPPDWPFARFMRAILAAVSGGAT